MIVSVYIDNQEYLTYNQDNVLANDCRLIVNGNNGIKRNETTYILSGKYYGSSTCIGEKGWIGYWNDENNSLVSCKEVVLVLKVKKDNTTEFIFHSVNIKVPDNYLPSNMSFEVNDSMIKRIFIKDLHRFARPVPLEISGIEFVI